MSSITADMKHVKSCEFGKKEQLRCLFCGGPQCSKCSDTAYLGMTNPAIPNLHSNWINDSILAMQRPSDSILIEGKVLEKFVSNRITAVFNLTEPGEHPYCGCGILTSSGFPYSPEKLMAAGIKHFNYSWQDMTVPSISLMMDIVNVACDEIAAGGKVAIHCHAGFGRTGITAACIMIASDQLESAQVVQFVRKRRPGSIQTAAQEKFVYKFERAFYTMMHVYPMTEPVDGKVEPPDARRRKSNGTGSALYHKTIAQSIKDQQYTLTAEEKLQDRFRWSHRLVYHSVSALSKLSVDDFNYATLAITGLTKLVPKSLHGSSYNDMINDTVSISVHSYTPSLSSSPIGSGTSEGKKAVSRFMVASNSLSDCNEESIMYDMKLEINLNKYARLVSVGDIVSSALKMDSEAAAASPNKMSILPTAKSVSRISSENNSAKGSVASTPKGSVASIGGAAAAIATLSVTGSADVDSSDSDTDMVPTPSKGFHPTMRVNSFKQNSTTDYARSKRVSSNLIGQLLLDWIETRRDPVFEPAVLDDLRSLWRAYSAATALSTPFEKALSIRISAVDVTSGKEAPRSPLSGRRPVAASSGEEAASPASVLYRDIKKLIESSLDRYKLVLLSDIMGMYRQFRAIGRKVHGGEVAPIDCLVGLRLAIALIHGRKQHFALIRHRALNMDVVKVFLLKHTHTDRVIINNITFSKETNYETSRNNMGPELIDNLEMVVDTFEVLLEYHWKYARPHADKVSWSRVAGSEGDGTAAAVVGEADGGHKK